MTEIRKGISSFVIVCTEQGSVYQILDQDLGVFRKVDDLGMCPFREPLLGSL